MKYTLKLAYSLRFALNKAIGRKRTDALYCTIGYFKAMKRIVEKNRNVRH